MQQALSGMVGAVAAPSTAAAAPQPPPPDWSAQLQHMKEMGIVDEVIALPYIGKKSLECPAL